jgi:acyl-CoA thioesterase-2
VAIEKILDLEQLEVNIYRGSVFGAESAAWQRTFGGQVAGQSLVSAVRTVDPRRFVHSLHGYFLRPGDPKVPTIYLVERLRDGGSFCTRRVNAIQHGETIFSMSASFQVAQSGIEHQDAMPSAPQPDDLPELRSMTVFDDEGFRQFDEWDVRIVPDEELEHLPGLASQQQVWFRHRDPLSDDPVLHICALAYMSDLTLLASAQVIHLDERDHLQVASLDHAMWFMRAFRADEWLLYDQSSPSACGGRSLTQGKIFNRSGELVAAVMQEGLTRDTRDCGSASRCAPATIQSAQRDAEERRL